GERDHNSTQGGGCGNDPPGSPAASLGNGVRQRSSLAQAKLPKEALELFIGIDHICSVPSLETVLVISRARIDNAKPRCWAKCPAPRLFPQSSSEPRYVEG